MRYAIRKKNLSPKEKWILCCIASHYDALTGKCAPGNKQLVLDTALSLPALKGGIKVLEELNEIEVYRPTGKGARNQFTILGMGGKDGRGNKKPTQKFEYMFAGFWAIYPRKVKKKLAYAAYLKLNPTFDEHKAIIDHLRERVNDDWKNADMKFIMHPATFINGECWINS